MKEIATFLHVDLQSWVFGTIEKVQQGVEWNIAWQDTYRDLGGESESTGRKGCPMNGTRTLYLMGRIKGSGMPYKNVPIRSVTEEYSKNGVYALLALAQLAREPEMSLDELWTNVRKLFREEVGEEPALSNQGGPTIAYKL